MDEITFCQSCGMPLDGTDLQGTEADGRLSEEYCIECYQSGNFVQPGLTMEGMRKQIVEIMLKDEAPADIIEEAVLRLPHLKRWLSHSLIGSSGAGK